MVLERRSEQQFFLIAETARTTPRRGWPFQYAHGDGRGGHFSKENPKYFQLLCEFGGVSLGRSGRRGGGGGLISVPRADVKNKLVFGQSGMAQQRSLRRDLPGTW